VASNKSTDREARDRLRRFTARQAVHEHRGVRRRRDNLAAIGGLVVVAAIAGVLQVFYFASGPGAPTPEPSPSAVASADPADPNQAGQNTGEVPDPSVAEDRVWTGTLTLNDIPLGIELDGVAAPQAVASFVTGIADGYYDGKTCHRLVTADTAGLIQCGSLDGTGASDPSYGFGPVENAPADGVYPAGTIAMARVGNDAFSQGRQFFVVYQDTPLPADAAGGYTVFGHVTSGLDALIAQIAAAGTADGSGDGAPAVATTITGVTIQ
jgi:peptidyl-prolyl cis-trans isomerase B (cyclophilin B)